MSDAVVIAIIVAVPGTLASIGAVVIGVINALKTEHMKGQLNGQSHEIAALHTVVGQQFGITQGLTSGKQIADIGEILPHLDPKA